MAIDKILQTVENRRAQSVHEIEATSAEQVRQIREQALSDVKELESQAAKELSLALKAQERHRAARLERTKKHLFLEFQRALYEEVYSQVFMGLEKSITEDPAYFSHYVGWVIQACQQLGGASFCLQTSEKEFRLLGKGGRLAELRDSVSAALGKKIILEISKSYGEQGALLVSKESSQICRNTVTLRWQRGEQQITEIINKKVLQLCRKES